MLVGYGNYNTYLKLELNVSGTTVTGTISGALGQAYTAVSVGSKPVCCRFPGRIIWRYGSNIQRVDKTINNASPPGTLCLRGCQHWIGRGVVNAKNPVFRRGCGGNKLFIGDMAYRQTGEQRRWRRHVNAN